MNKYNCVSPTEMLTQTALLKICNIYIFSSNSISSLHIVCVLNQLYGAEHLSPGKNSNYINAAVAPFIGHRSRGLNLIVTCVLSLQQLPSSGKANHQKVAPDSVVNAKYTEIHLASTSLISFCVDMFGEGSNEEKYMLVHEKVPQKRI